MIKSKSVNDYHFTQEKSLPVSSTINRCVVHKWCEVCYSRHPAILELRQARSKVADWKYYTGMIKLVF